MDFHSMRRKELQALCKKHKTPANLTNLEMANRLTSLLKGKDKFFTGRRSSLKALDENESGVENKRVKKVRFSPETQMIEFKKSEAEMLEVKRRGRRKSVIYEVLIIENVGGPELSEGFGPVTRSRGRRLVEEGVAEREGGKRGAKDDALGNSLPSADVENEEHRMVRRRSLRNREVVDEGKKKNEDMEKCSKKKGRQRNLRQRNVKGNDDVAERRESDVECCVRVQAEKVLRRSKRNVTKVTDYKLLSNEMVATGRSLKPVVAAEREGSGSSGVDIDAAMVEKESSPAGVAMRRSRRNASRHEPLIILDDLVADANYERKPKKQRRDPTLEEEAVKIDSITIEMPLRRLSRNVNRSEKAAPAIAAAKVAPKEKRKSKKQTEKIEDSFPEDLTTKELPDVDVQPYMTEVAESAIRRDSDNEGCIDNLKQQRKRSRKNFGRKSSPKVQASPMGVNWHITASESAELKNDDVEPGAETPHSRTKVVAQDVNATQEIKKKNSAEYRVPNYHSVEPAAHCPSGTAEQECFEDSSAGGDVISSEKLSVADRCVPIDQSETTDPKGIQVWVELSMGMQTLSRPASLDHGVEDEGISSEKSQECIEHKGLETVRCDVLEKYGNASLNGPCERDGFTSFVKDKTCEFDPANSEDAMTAMVSGCDNFRIADPNYNDDRSSTLNSGRELEQRDPSLSMQANGCEVDNVVGDRNFDQEELKCTRSAKSDEHNLLEGNYGASDKCCESNVPEPSRSVTSMLEDGNANGGEDSKEPADLLGKHLASPSIAANVVETNCTQIESSTGISSFGSITIPLECNLTLEDPEFGAVSETIVKSGQSFLQDTNAQKQEESVYEMDLEKYLEPRKQSPSIRRNDVASDDVAEVEKHFADVKSSAELPKSDEEENTVDKFGQSNAFDSSACKLGMLGDLDANVGKDFVGDADSQRFVLAAQDFAAQTIEGSKKSYEDEPDKDENADFIESCIADTEKKDNNYEELANSEVSMAAITSGTDNIVYIPTRDDIEESTTSTMKLDTTLEQEQSPFLQMYGSVVENVAEEDRTNYQVAMNGNELAQSVEDGHFEEQYHSPNIFSEYSVSDPSRSARRMLKDDIFNGGEDSIKGQKNTAGSKPEKDGSAGFIESCVREECTSAEKDNYEENPANSEDAMAAMKCRTSIFPHVSVGHNNDESISAMNLDITLEQREQSPIVHRNGCEAGSVAEVDRNYRCDELTKSADDRPLEERYHAPNKCWESSIFDSSIRSARSMLQDEIDDGEDSIEHQKNVAGSKKSYEDEPDEGENVGFIQSCLREECTSAKRYNNYEENPVNSDDAMTAMKCRTGNSLHVSVVHNNDESTSIMNLDMSLEQREHSPVVHRNGCEADSVAEVDTNYDQVELKCDELSKSVEDRLSKEKYHSPDKCTESSARSILQDGEDSIKCQKNTTSSRKTYEDGPEKDGNTCFTDSCITEKCISTNNDSNCEEVPDNTEDPMEAVISGTGNFAHIPLVDNNEHTGSRNSDMALHQREQSPILQMNGCDADNVAEEGRGRDQVEVSCYESAESVEYRCLEERYHSRNMCLESGVSDSSRRSAGRMLQDEIVSGSEDSSKHQDKSYEDAPEADGNAGSIKSYAIDKYTTVKIHEDNPENSKDAMEVTNIPAMQKNGCVTDNVAEKDGNHEHKDLSCDKFAKSVEHRPFKERYHSPDKCWEPSASDPSGRILQDEIINAGEDSSKSADLVGTSTVAPSLAAKTVERNCSVNDFSASISNFGSTDPLTLDRPEFEEVSGEDNKSGHSPSPDKIVQKQEEITDAMQQSSSVLRNSFGADVAEAYKNFEDVKNCVELASFERGNNDAEDVVDVKKSQGVVLAVQKCSSYVIEASDTSAEGIHSPSSDNDAQQQGLTAGDETFAEDRKKEDSDGNSEKISDFASTELSEVKFTLNIQEEFSCKDEEDNAKDERENLAATFSQVQFTMLEIHSEEKIVEDIEDGVASKLYKHHEMLEESDVLDTINEYIDSESTRNSSLRIDDTSDTLHIDVLTKVAEPEAKKAQGTIDTTGRKFEPHLKEMIKMGEAADLAETALGSAWISESKTATLQNKNSDVMADKNSFLGKQFKSEMREKNIRAILIHGTPKKLQMAADMKENMPSSKMERIGSLTTVKPATERPALKVLPQK